MATLSELAVAKYPEEINGNRIIPMQGMSLAWTFNTDSVTDRTLFWEHEGNRGIRKGKWKLVSEAWPVAVALDSLEVLPVIFWELYDMEKDRSEMNNLADQYPERVKEMAAEWQNWATIATVIPKPPQKLRISNKVRSDLLKKIKGTVN